MENKLLNESQLKNNVVSYLLENNIAKSKEEAEKMLNEGLWDKIKSGLSNLANKTKTGLSNLATSTKYGLGKLGTITAGGKYLGQSKAKAAAQTQIDSELKKKGNKMILDLDNTLKTQFPGFPNVKNKEQFIAGVEAIGRVYESVVAATKLPPDSKGYLTPKKANNIIKSLRMYVQKKIDYDLASAYRMFNENDEKYYQENQFILFEAAKGPLTGTKETETEKVYKSNKAPLTLLGIGTALGAFGWLTHTDWFKGLFATKSQIPVTDWVSQDTTKVLGSVQPGQGMTQTLNATMGSSLGPNSKPEELIKVLSKLGGGNPEKGVELLTAKGGLFPDSVGAKAALTDIVNNPHGNGDTLGQIFQGKIAGTGKIAGDVLVTKAGGAIVGAIKTMVPKIVMMTAIKTGAGYAAAKGLGGVLGPLGVGLIAAGALVKGLRVKGLKSSRMKTLKDLLVGMNDVALVKQPKVKPEEQPIEEPKAKKQTKKKTKANPEAQEEPITPAAPLTPAASTTSTKLNYNYTTPTSSQATTSYTVPGVAPQQGATTATTTTPTKKTATKPAANKGAKVTKKTTTKKKQPTNLAEAFQVIVNELNKKRMI
jgi:hypothetical protein